jgi:hypothetical protein
VLFQEFEGEGKLNGNCVNPLEVLLTVSLLIGPLLNELESVSANDMKNVLVARVLYWLGAGRAYWPYGEVEESTCIGPEGISSIAFNNAGSNVVSELQSMSLNGLGEESDAGGAEWGTAGGEPKKLNGA